MSVGKVLGVGQIGLVGQSVARPTGRERGSNAHDALRVSCATGLSATAALTLQRTAGNRAAVAAIEGGLFPAAPTRKLARCQGACRCGGVCQRSDHDEELAADMRRRLGRAVAARAALSEMPAAGRTLARTPLTSPRFQSEPRLQDCADDKARMKIPDSDGGGFQPVSKVQQALLDWAAMKGVTVDLGTTGPAGNGVDGIYGPKTAAAVKAFKATEHLGFEEFGDVGPGTMQRLNELFPASGPPPPPPPPPPITPDDQKHKDAFDDRRHQLQALEGRLAAMQSVVLAATLWQPGDGPQPSVVASFPREVCVVRFFLHARPEDPDYFDTLGKARELVHKDLTPPVQPLTFRSTTPGFCDPGPAQNFAATCAPGACSPLGTQLCDPTWYDSSRHCRSDVLIHETYHWLGLPKDGVDFPSETKPADAFQNADTMTQFGNALMGLEIDNCVSTQRKSTTFPAALAACLTPPPSGP